MKNTRLGVTDYQFQHNAHVIDWHMFTWMMQNPLKATLVPSAEYRECERAWVNYQSQLHYGWIKR